MSRISRISERVSEAVTAALATVRCPGCGNFVVPTIAPAEDGTDNAEDTGERWSYIWLPPRGEICPDCDFPLERYLHRRKWIWLFLAGVSVATVSLFLLGLAGIGGTRGGPLWQVAIVGTGTGLVFLLVGAVGIVIGGRHSVKPHDEKETVKQPK
jgi:hypothetical protein